MAEALPDGEAASPHAAAVLAGAAQHAVNAGQFERARQLAERGIAVANSNPTRRFPLEVLADLHLFQGDLDAAGVACRDLLAAADESGDLHSRVNALTVHALAFAYAGSPETAHRRLDALPPSSSLAPSDQGWIAFTEGEITLDREPGHALAALQRAIALADAVDNQYLGGVARLSACSLQARSGEPIAALEAFAAVIQHWRQRGAKTHLVTTLRNFVTLFRRLGAAAEAAELLGATRAHEVAPPFGEEAGGLSDTDSWTRKVLGESTAARHLAIGGGRNLEDATLATLDWIAGQRVAAHGGQQPS